MKRILMVLAGLGLTGVAVAAVGGGGMWMVMGSQMDERLNKVWDVQGDDIPIPWPLTEAEVDALRAEKLGDAEPDPEVDPLADIDLGAIAMERAVARGTALIDGRLPCGECHGKDGAGQLVADAQPVWTWYAPNITSGGVTHDYTPADWDRIIRHGVKKDGTTATMPSVDFMSLSDQEVSDLAAYFTSREPVAEPQPPTVIGPIGRMLLGSGTLPLSAELIDHEKSHPDVPPASGVNLEFGAHVAATCVGCHRLGYEGGPIAQGPPDWPPAANLTPEGSLAGWSEEDFVALLRTGKRPDGTSVQAPMSDVTKMALTDDEVKSMFLYLQSVPGKPTGI